MANRSKTKNDTAWEILFEQYNILENIKRNEQFIISSTQINKVRESRLMAKFDQFTYLPRIFRANRLSILPISRSEYLIAPFVTHYDVIYDSDLETIYLPLPFGIQTIDQSNIYSEAIALNCAFNIGMIDDVAGEETRHTISGRMSTGNFDFIINSSITGKFNHMIGVNGAQCEIDGGFEGSYSFLLIEAKNYKVKDFLVRQLYYAYRLWSDKLSKRVIPVLMTFSQDTFDFFIYEFITKTDYSSLQLIQQKKYAIAQELITIDDIYTVFARVRIVSEPADIPFPQADSFERVVDLLSQLTIGVLTKDEITEKYQFKARQTDYYTRAGKYLGLIDQYIDPITQDITFKLTEDGQQLLKQKHKQKTLGLIQKILEHRVFHDAFQKLRMGRKPTKEEISSLISSNVGNIGGETIPRRASTVRGWIEWIWKQIED